MISLKSEVTKKLLNYFFLNPQEKLYVNELSRTLELDKRNLVKKLRELEKEGLLNSYRQGNLKIYSINKKYPLHEEYKKIVLKTIGLESKLKEVFKEIKAISKAYVYGSYAKGRLDSHSDIDILIVGNHDIISLQRKLNRLQKETGREINVVNMDEKELKKRLKNKDPFIEGIFKNKYVEII